MSATRNRMSPDHIARHEADTDAGESLKAFKDSFAYGRRNDLLFKFMKDLSPEDAARFLQELLIKIGDADVSGRVDQILEHVVEWQILAYGTSGQTWTYETGPFTPLAKPLADCRIALLTSSGHFVEGDDPRPFGVADMSQDEATRRIGEFVRARPVLSVIPSETPNERLRARHGGYDIRGAVADPNVAFPLERMRECQRDGLFGTLAPEAYSFVGATAQVPIINECGPAWAGRLKQQSVDAAVLVPV